MKIENYAYMVWAYFVLMVIYPINILVRGYEWFMGERNNMYWGF